MASFVVDASVTLSWCFEDEAKAGADAFLERLRGGDQVCVPAHWPPEVANGLLMALRKNRINRAASSCSGMNWQVNRYHFAGSLSVAGSLSFMSWHPGKWHWFPRGGAMMALCGFIVAVRETLLWRPPRPVETRIIPGVAAVGLRTGPLGVPIFPPKPSDDPDLTQEEIDADYERQQRDWDEAEILGEGPEEVILDEGDAGRPMRDTSTFTVDDLAKLKHSSVLGVLGTFIWAFGDLLGGLPK